jgi:hypothetical protein
MNQNPYVLKFSVPNTTPMEIFQKRDRKRDHLSLGKLLLLAWKHLKEDTFGGLAMGRTLIFIMILGSLQVHTERLSH